ncbi:MAG: T9SS type A sorting domain-containing protein [Ignavibacteriales bacterium]|nr:T9SS type A sorting domain-containing protein [Ignavibacteriales bacterium]
MNSAKHFILFLSLLFQQSIFSQLSDPALRRIGYLDSNAVSISFYNDGAISGFNIGTDIRGLWQDNYYIGDMTFMVGLELINSRGDTLHPVIIPRSPRNGQSSEHHPTLGYFWGFNPVAGYIEPNQQSIAMSNNPASWPTLWEDHPEWGSGVWNGLKGANSFSTTLETYFKVNDTWDDEFNSFFLPDTSDSTIKGYGISVGVRYFQSNDPLFKNTIIRMYDIENRSDYKYEKVFWGNITGTLVGGDGDSGDDLSFYNCDNDFIYAWDNDDYGNKGQRVGYIAEGFLQTPDNKRTGSFHVFNIAASPDLSNDQLLWNKFLPGYLDTAYVYMPMDCDYMYGTNYFSLEPGETKRLVVTLTLGNSLSEVTQEILSARALWNSKFDTTIVHNSIKLVNLDSHLTLSGEQNIQWNSSRSNGSIDLWFSANNGETWEQITVSQPNTGSYVLNTNELEDTPFGIFKIFIKDSIGNIYGFNQSHAVTIDNEKNGKPYVKILNTEFSSGNEINHPTIPLQLLIGDAEQNPLSANIYYSINGGVSYNQFDYYEASPDTLSQIHTIFLGDLPNSGTAKLKVVVTDFEFSSYDTTESFSKSSARDTLDASLIRNISGFCNIPYRIHIVDSSLTVTDSYLLTFDDTSSTTQKYLTVRDVTSGADIIQHEPLYPKVESSIFNGLTFYSEDRSTEMDTAKTGWNSGNIYPLTFLFSKFIWSNIYTQYNGYLLPNDYQIEFYDHTADTSIADTLYPPNNIIPMKEVNFKIKNLSTDKYIDFVYWKFAGSVSTIFNIYFKEVVGNQQKRTWRLNFYYNTAGATLPVNDTLTIRTIKGLSYLDSIMIGFVSGVEDKNQLPVEYKLEQNYPNPFNPITTIRYQLPVMSKVKIGIYNLLGQQVVSLVDDVKQAGHQSVEWNASNISTGIYFYRFIASGIAKPEIHCNKIGKMIFIK